MDRRLKFLKYSQYDNINLANDKNFIDIIIFCEENYIRRYNEEDRRNLMISLRTSKWVHLNEYLQHNLCPFQFSPFHDNRVHIIDWVLSAAIRYKNHDRQQEMSKFQHISSQELESFFQEVEKLIGIKFISDDHLKNLEIVERILREHMTEETLKKFDKFHSIDKSEEENKMPKFSDIAKRNLSTILDSSSLDGIPLGFRINNKNVEVGGKLLRMLYVNEMKQLQLKVNSILSIAQEFTEETTKK
ncbi:hypothetical protein SNEBB_000888 [Seison nebaliae]|nr:hypothetical protein SNEBB_000888 [Seison nebaliae]